MARIHPCRVVSERTALVSLLMRDQVTGPARRGLARHSLARPEGSAVMPSDPSAAGSAPNGSPPPPEALPVQPPPAPAPPVPAPEPPPTVEPPQALEPPEVTAPAPDLPSPRAGDGDRSVPDRGRAQRTVRRGAGGGASRGVATVLLALGDSWGAVLFLGCTSLLLGAAVVAWPNVTSAGWPTATTRTVGILLGAQILLYGLCHLLRAMAASDVDGGRRVLVALLGLEALVVGVLLVRGVAVTEATLGLVAGLFWLVAGVIAALSEFVGRARPGRGPAMLGGLLAIAASIAVLSYPEASLTLAADVLGGYAVVLGALTIVQAFQIRNAQTGPPADRGQGRVDRGVAAGG